PALAYSTAKEAPIPLLPPEIKATFPSSPSSRVNKLLSFQLSEESLSLRLSWLFSSLAPQIFACLNHRGCTIPRWCLTQLCGFPASSTRRAAMGLSRLPLPPQSWKALLPTRRRLGRSLKSRRLVPSREPGWHPRRERALGRIHPCKTAWRQKVH